MDQLIQQIVDRNFQDFKGARIAGTLVLSDALVNELLGAAWEASQATTQQSAETPTSGGVRLDTQQIIGALNIQKLSYHTEQGKSLLELDANI